MHVIIQSLNLQFIIQCYRKDEERKQTKHGRNQYSCNIVGFTTYIYPTAEIWAIDGIH